jgi:hypothetical protein
VRWNLSLGVLYEAVGVKTGNSSLLLTLRVGYGKEGETAMELEKTGRFFLVHHHADIC